MKSITFPVFIEVFNLPSANTAGNKRFGKPYGNKKSLSIQQSNQVFLRKGSSPLIRPNGNSNAVFNYCETKQVLLA